MKKRPIEERFFEKVVMIPFHDCWEWSAYKNAKGYGVIGDGRKTRLSHRVSYEIHFGKIPDGLLICHKCDNPGCNRPDHLFLGTPADNTRDMVEKKRIKGRSSILRNRTHCPEGHLFAGDNLFIESDGSRRCRECKRQRSRELHAVRPAANAKKCREYRNLRKLRDPDWKG